MTVWGGLVRTARPQQWTKNILVLVAPAAAGVLLQPERLAAALTAGAAFCLASSGVYFINDVRDVRADRLHPQKCRRPVAAGVVPVPTALAAGVILLLCALGVSAAVSSALVLVLLTYEVVQVTYCLGLKDQPVLELVSVASGFLLRAVAGASPWPCRSHRGSSSPPASVHCSWRPASGMPRHSWWVAPAWPCARCCATTR